MKPGPVDSGQGVTVSAPLPLPPFATDESAENVYMFFIRALKDIYRQGMNQGVIPLQSACRSQYCVSPALFDLIEYLCELKVAHYQNIFFSSWFSMFPCLRNIIADTN